MGDYVEVYVNTDLHTDTPEEVVDCLKWMCKWPGANKPDFAPEEWSSLFTNSSFYNPIGHCGILIRGGRVRPFWSILGKGDTRAFNDGAVMAFFAWLSPWPRRARHFSDFVGYAKYDFRDTPCLVYAKTENGRASADFVSAHGPIDRDVVTVFHDEWEKML